MLAVRNVIRRSQPRAPLRRFLEHPRTIGANAEINRQATAEFNRILDVEREECRIGAAAERERIVFVVLERALAERCLFAFFLVCDEERKRLIQAQSCGFDDPP